MSPPKGPGCSADTSADFLLVSATYFGFHSCTLNPDIFYRRHRARRVQFRAGVSRVNREFYNAAQQDAIYKQLLVDLLRVLPEQDTSFYGKLLFFDETRLPYRERFRAVYEPLRLCELKRARKLAKYERQHIYALLSRPAVMFFLYLGFYALSCKADQTVPSFLPGVLLRLPWAVAGAPILGCVAALAPLCVGAFLRPGLADYRGLSLEWLTLIGSLTLLLLRLDGLRISLMGACLPALFGTCCAVLLGPSLTGRAIVSRLPSIFCRRRRRRHHLAPMPPLPEVLDLILFAVVVAVAVPAALRVDAPWPWMARVPWWVVLLPFAVPGLLLARAVISQGGPKTILHKMALSALTWVPYLAEYYMLCLRLQHGWKVPVRGFLLLPLLVSWVGLSILWGTLREQITFYNPASIEPTLKPAVVARRRQWWKAYLYVVLAALSLVSGLEVIDCAMALWRVVQQPWLYMLAFTTLVTIICCA
ncbi:hypothetical protein PAPYR_939 [Paratrimastix pyriformis]|uniref:Uncharacterized protein n=1 Tax=Paratrimastix pyriformis TaxID=342808 RepID=A0ABQ8UT62_9EUKA|nr:hypothetical protein PAPYR_939 [Paratrimastix pyriformis]